MLCRFGRDLKNPGLDQGYNGSGIGVILLGMDWLTAFGLFAVTAMLVCYALEDRSPFFVLGFAGACALGSIYGFLQGAWPFGLIEAVWAGVALWRWKTRMA